MSPPVPKLGAAIWRTILNFHACQYVGLNCYHITFINKKHLKNVGPIRDCEPPHAHSPGVVTGTVAHRLCIDVHDANANDDDDNDNA